MYFMYSGVSAKTAFGSRQTAFKNFTPSISYKTRLPFSFIPTFLRLRSEWHILFLYKFSISVLIYGMYLYYSRIVKFSKGRILRITNLIRESSHWTSSILTKTSFKPLSSLLFYVSLMYLS